MGTVIHTSRFKAKPVKAKSLDDCEFKFTSALDSFRRVVDKLESRVPFALQGSHDLMKAIYLFEANGWIMQIKHAYCTDSGHIAGLDLLVTNEQLQALMGC